MINNQIKIKDIPEEAFLYTVNGQSPLEWVVARYGLSINKESQIVSDPNKFSKEKDYVLKLIFKSIKVGIESHRLIQSIPKLDIIP